MVGDEDNDDVDDDDAIRSCESISRRTGTALLVLVSEGKVSTAIIVIVVLMVMSEFMSLWYVDGSMITLSVHDDDDVACTRVVVMLPLSLAPALSLLLVTVWKELTASPNLAKMRS